MRSITLVLPAALALAGCMSQDVPQAHRGRMFDRTGMLAFYAGGDGFVGKVLDPGTYWTGIYDEVRMVDCSQNTTNETLHSLTKDGVQFGLDVYVTYSINCSNTSVVKVMSVLGPDASDGRTISAGKVYQTYIRPALGESVREAVSPYRANDINDQREKILADIGARFHKSMAEPEREVVSLQDLVLSNMDYPDEMDHANNERAVQAVLRAKSIAERERVEAEIETAKTRQILAEQEGRVEAAKIDQIGQAIRRNPEYLQYQLQEMMPEIYSKAGASGNMVITAPSPNVLVVPRQGAPAQ
jgi:hypothetical protein